MLFRSKGVFTLSRPLSRASHQRGVVEIYRKSPRWCFYSIFFEAVPRFSGGVPRTLVDRSADFFGGIGSALHEMRRRGAEDFPVEISRKSIRKHLQRERSAAVARFAKRRDQYICRICRFNFSTFYGILGRQFAEAHHVESVSKLREGVAVKPSDILTVCSNCHRMLHRLGGGKGAVRHLRRLVAATVARASTR